MNISFIIPNFNGVDLLKKNLPVVLSISKHYNLHHHGNAEIIVIDDASSDESVAFLEELSHEEKNILLMKNEKNLGFAGTVNKGARQASGEILILLNTDVSPEKDFLEPLLKHFSDGSVFAVGCMDKSIEGEKVVLRGRGIGSWKRGFLIHAAGELDGTNTLWVSGGSGAFRKSLWDTLGGLHELYSPFYWEDIDLSYRALKSGYNIVFEMDSVVIHEHEKGAIKSSRSDADIKTIAYRNQFFFVWLNATDSSVILSQILWLPYHLLSALKRRDVSFFKGFFQAFLKLRKVIQLRIRVVRTFNQSDREVTAGFKQ